MSVLGLGRIDIGLKYYLLAQHKQLTIHIFIIIINIQKWNCLMWCRRHRRRCYIPTFVLSPFEFWLVTCQFHIVRFYASSLLEFFSYHIYAICIICIQAHTFAIYTLTLLFFIEFFHFINDSKTIITIIHSVIAYFIVRRHSVRTCIVCVSVEFRV